MDLNQVTLDTADLARSVAFYTRLGLHQIVDSEHYARFECPDGGATFSLHTAAEVAPTAALVYFECQELDADVARLRTAGIVFEQLPVDRPWGWREARLRDPDGHPLCLYQAGHMRRFPPWRSDRATPAAGTSNDLDDPANPDSERFFAAIDAAAERLAGIVHRTPVVTSATLDRRFGARVFLKAECLQLTGAFKYRGACNALLQLDPAQRERGVLTYSSGNHAQALARAGAQMGVSVTVVMPQDAPAVKRAATEGYGAEVVLYAPRETRRETLGERLAGERGLTVIPPYDHPDVIAGQGTAALELLSQVGSLDVLLVPTGGAGLLSGCALACAKHAPQCRVIGVEPELADDATRSFRTGVLHTVDHPATIADGVRTPSLGAWTFPLVRRHVADMYTVSEARIAQAVYLLFTRVKLVVEPSGALGVAALIDGLAVRDRRVGVILSGGNVDPQSLVRLLHLADG